MVEIAAENNSTTVFPIPMDLFQPIVEAGKRFKALGERSGSPGDLLKTPEAEASENALPAGVDPAMLTEGRRPF